MKIKYIAMILAALFLFPLVLAHDENGGSAELKTIKDYTIELHDDNGTIAFSIEHNSSSVNSVMSVEVYRNGKLEFSQDNIQAQADDHYVVDYKLSDSFYEIRPMFHIGNDIVFAQFSLGTPQKSAAVLWILIIPVIGIVAGIIKRSKILIAGGIVVVILLGVVYAYSPLETTKIHEHADFAVFLDGVQYNFSQERFMTYNSTELSEIVHMHDMKGNIIHVHAKGVTLDLFFGTLGIKFNSTCFIVDGLNYCNDGTRTIRMYVNGRSNNEFDNYQPKDLDRILITYGSENDAQLASQISSVTNEACIQSGKCPERGTAPEESCSAGKCED